MAKTFPSEIRTFSDPRTGRRIRQLTNYKGHSHHLYFTNPGWFDNGRRLLFASDRGGRTNLFSIELESGLITQHTDADMPGPPHETSFLFGCLNPRRPEAYFWRGQDLTAIDLVTNRERRLYRAPERFMVNMLNVTADGGHICTGLFEDLSATLNVDLLHGYVGFGEYWAAKPLSLLMAIPTDGGPAREVFRENYWMGHVNTSPTQSNILTFCHEGPWVKVDNRIWGCDLSSGRVWPIRPRSGPDEAIGHEYWYADGIHIGFHGSRAGKPFFGRIHCDNSELFEVSFPGHTGHIHSNDFNNVVGDHKVVRLWRWNGSSFDGPRMLCQHRSSMHIQQTHVHPRFAPDGRRVVFTSDATGYGQVYEVEVGDFGDLPPVED